MEKNTPEQLAHQIIAFYNEYDLRVSGKINNQTAYQLIETIEQKYQTDTIRLSDGTRLWNLLRIFIYSNFQKLGTDTTQKKFSKNSIKSVLSLFKESFIPLRFPKNITVCGFSSSESRKLYNNTYYDIYLDPLYEILGDKLAVFEWPETTGYRRKYNHPVYSRHHVPMHIPLSTKTFWNLLFNRLTGRKILHWNQKKSSRISSLTLAPLPPLIKLNSRKIYMISSPSLFLSNTICTTSLKR
jgi:hypothetical protein